MVHAQIDATPYHELKASLEDTKQLYERAQGELDVSQTIALRSKIDSIEGELSSPRLLFLKRYVMVSPTLDLSESIMSDLEDLFGQNNILRRNLDELNSLSGAFEQSYDSELFEKATIEMSSAYEASIELLRGQIEYALDSIESTLSESQAFSAASPSAISMVEEAKESLVLARAKIARLSDAYSISDIETYLSILSNIRSDFRHSAEVMRTSESELSILEYMKIVLLAIPLVLLACLFVFFKTLVRKKVVSANFYPKSVPPGGSRSIQCNLSIRNPENRAIDATIRHVMPDGAEAYDFDYPPLQIKDGELSWDFEILPSAIISLSYKIMLPSKYAGCRILMPSPTLEYSLDDKERVVRGKQETITLEN